MKSSGLQVPVKASSWVGDNIYMDVDGVPYLVDTGAQVFMTRRNLETKGHLNIRLGTGKVKKMPNGMWRNIVWLKGPHDLVCERFQNNKWPH